MASNASRPKCQAGGGPLERRVRRRVCTLADLTPFAVSGEVHSELLCCDYGLPVARTIAITNAIAMPTRKISLRKGFRVFGSRYTIAAVNATMTSATLMFLPNVLIT